MKKIKRARRCQLAVPGSDQKMISKAAKMDVDHIFLDLEDAVSPNAKESARENIILALNELDFGHSTRCVRINGLESEWCYEDIIKLIEGAGQNIDTLMIPKVRHPADVLFVETLLKQLEKKLHLHKPIGIELLIEELDGLINCEAIATSTPRLESMILGTGDFAAAQGINVPNIGSDSDDYSGDLWHYHRTRITIACRTAGIDPIDGPYADFKNREGYRRQAARARTLGMVGKWAIHPSQIEDAQTLFTPDPAKIEQARRYIADYEKAKAEGKGAIAVDGVLVDEASARIFRELMKTGELYGL